MVKMLQRLWNEQDGVVISSELILFSTVVVIGMLVGLQTVRESVVQELGDFANAIGNINQSYSYAGLTGHHSSTAGSVLIDVVDDCDVSVPVTTMAPMCITVCGIAASNEG